MNRIYKVLLVEDDNKLRSTVTDYLQINNFSVTACADGNSAISSFETKSPFDIVLLDGMLPDIDGFDVLKKIRETSNVPVIILSARESEREQLNGFRLGADNYITKPFLLSILKEHINVLLARTKQQEINTSSSDLIVKGALKLNTVERKVYINGNMIDTTPREYDLLEFFVTNEKIVFSRNTILDRVWGQNYFGDLRTVDTIIKQLRKKLGNYSNYIASVYGVGYKFEVCDEK